MGYQESFLVCKNKNNFEQLCQRLNSAKSQIEDDVTVFSVGKFKKEISLLDCGSIPADTYFVWWGGERHPYQSGINIATDETAKLNLSSNLWHCIFCEYVADLDVMLNGSDLDEKIGVLQENDFLCIFELPENDTIQEEYLKQVK